MPVSPRAADTDVVINEIMYHPDSDCEAEEFIELYNRNPTDPVPVGNWYFAEGVTYIIPPGTQIGPNQYLVICANPTAFTAYYGAVGATVLGPWTGKLSNDGEDIDLVNALGTRVDYVRYNDKRPWPISPDGAGPSLELVNPNDDNTSAGAWRAAGANSFSQRWTRYQVEGVPSSTTVYFYLDSAGQCLIDDVELRATTSPAANYILNGGFETAAPLQWTATGTHGGSARVTTDFHTGAACLRVVSTGAGGEASGQVWQACQTPAFNGPRYTLSFWIKGLPLGVILRGGLRGGGGLSWTPSSSEDIGSPGSPGGYSYNVGTNTYRVWGAGSDIWGASDQFHFLYVPVVGDASLEATVSWVTNPAGDGWAKAGMMFRETNAADSKFAYALLSYSNGVDFQFRTQTGGGAANAGPDALGGPVGLRIAREGDQFIGSENRGAGYGENGRATIAMTPTALLGMAVTSHAGAPLTTASFAQPQSNVSGGFYVEGAVPAFAATPGSQNSCYSANTPPYIRNVDTFPDLPTSADPIQVRAKVTDLDGIASVQLQYQIVAPGSYIRIGDPAYGTNWTTLAMTTSSTPSVYVATIPAQPHRTLVRYRITARDGASEQTTVPYADDSEPNYARFVYNGVPSYYASPRPGAQPFRTHTVLSKLPVIHLIANPADVTEAQAVSINDRVERRQFKWYATVVYNGKVYDHIRFRMRGGTWRYKYNKRMWKLRFNRGHYLEFFDNDGAKYPEELRTINLMACIQTPGNVPTWVGDSQRGEGGIIEAAGFWLYKRAGAIAPETTWIQFRIVDGASEDAASWPLNERQYYGDFFGLYLVVQGMDERMLRMSNRPGGNLYKMDTFGASNPPWFVEAVDCALPTNDINTFISGYSGAPNKLWWETNFDLERYYAARAVTDCIHHGDLYAGKNYYYFHDSVTNKWEIAYWDLDLTFGTDHGDGSSPFRDRVVRNAGIPEFGIGYRNKLREVIQLQFTPEKFFPVLDEWRNLLVEMAAADMDRWDYAPATGPEDFSWQGHFRTLDTRVAALKTWINARANYLCNPEGRPWPYERSSAWPSLTCWDPNIPSTPTLTSPAPGAIISPGQSLVMRSTAYSDPNGSPHQASKWMLTRVGGNELQPDWSSGISLTDLTACSVPTHLLAAGRYWARVRHMDNTGRWSWWSDAVEVTIVGGSSAVPNWRLY